jgi:hypothetical protein
MNQSTMNDSKGSDTRIISREALQAGGALSPEELIEKLRSALARDGDFPASAKVVSELRTLCNDPKTTASQITEVILREPSLGTRVLHLVNSSFYRRAKPIMTVSQAVIQIGMRPLAEMCAGLVLLQKFVPTARQGGVFANCLRKTVLTSLLSSSVSAASNTTERGPQFGSTRGGRTDEFGYLAGSFAELGTLLLAFYFPKLYEAAVKRSESKKTSVAQGIKDLTGLSPVQLSLEVIDALKLPDFYKDVLKGAEEISQNHTGTVQKGVSGIAKAVSAGSQISQALVSGKTRQELDAVLAEVKATTGIDAKALSKVVADLPTVFKDHCISLDLQLPALPEFVATYSSDPTASDAASSGSGSSGSGSPGDAPGSAAASSGQDQQFNHFISEIRQAVESREPTSSVITSVMETFVFGLAFDRAVLLLMTPNKTKLIGRLALGKTDGVDPKSISRSLGSDAAPASPDARAVKESRPVFLGEPILEGGWPLAVLPIGFGQRCVGVIYADRIVAPNAGKAAGGGEISAKEQASIGILAELLDRSIALHA